MVEVIGNIEEDLVSEAIEYQRPSSFARLLRTPVFKLCACFVIIALVFVHLFVYNRKDAAQSSPFVLTAYAVSAEEGSIMTNIIKKGEKIPISIFKTESGLTGFVVSYNKTDSGSPSSIAIVSGGSYDNCIEEISGIVKDNTQNYFFFIPGENEDAPYTFVFSLSDAETNAAYEYRIAIEQIDGNYYVELSEIV